MKYYMLQRMFDSKSKQFFLHTLTAKNPEEAWESVEESIAGNMSQEWLMTKKELSELKRLLFKKG